MYKWKIMFQINTMMMCMENVYNDFLFRETIRETFICDGYIMLLAFFKSSMVEMLSNELFSNELQWKVEGPLNKK